MSAKIVETEEKCLRGKTAKAEERPQVEKILTAEEKSLSAKIVETEEKCLHGKTAKAEERAQVAKIAKAEEKA